MDIIVFRSHELPIALGAMRAVVRNLSLRHEQYLETIARLHGSPLRARQIKAAPPQLVAATIREHHARKRLVQLAIIMIMVDGRVLREPAADVTELARVLGVEEPAIATLPKLVERRTLATRVSVMRRVMRKFLSEAWRDQRWAGVRQVLGGFLGFSRDRATAQRFNRLAHFPAGSIGRALADYCVTNKFALPGNPGSIPERILFHDIGHLLSGYGTDPAGEIQQAAFQAGFVRKDGFVFLFFGIIQFHLGIKITPVAAPEVGYFDIERVMTAIARGAACEVDLSDRWDFWAVADRQLDQVRAQLRVSPPSAATKLAANG